MTKRKRRRIMAAVLIVLLGAGCWYLFLDGRITDADSGMANRIDKTDRGQPESIEVSDADRWKSRKVRTVSKQKKESLAMPRADQTIALVEYFLEQYNIDSTKVYGNEFSGGGETMSIVMGKRPDLFTAYLQVSSKWDGEYESVVEQHLPVYFAIGRNDEYYGCEPIQEAYDTFHVLYEQQGLTDEEIDELLILDIKEHDYFIQRGFSNEHGGAAFSLMTRKS